MGKIRVMAAYLLVLMLTVLPLAICGASESSAVTATKTTARTEVWKAITAGKTGSATVAVMDNGVTVYAEGFGMADRVQGVPVDKNTLFNIGSISKVYVATAIMLLADDGKVKLDVPVTTYLPEFTMADERYKDITVRMLLNHSSGLPGTVGPNSFGFQYHKEFYQDVLGILAKSHLKHRPGELAPYCNDGFTLAEMIVAKVSGMSYLDFLQKRIFTPLSLTYTGNSVAERPEKNLIAAKDYTAAGRVLPLEAISLLGSGGLSATAEDLCRFADSFSTDGYHILSPAAMVEMRKVQRSEFSGKLRNSDPGYGLGWDFAEIPALKAKGIDVLGKSGGTGEYNSMLFTVPDKRISVAVIFTGNKGGSVDLCYTLLETYLTGKGLLVKAPEPVKPPVKGEAIPAELAAYEGYYTNGNGLLRLSLDMPANILNVYNVSGSEETKAFSGVYQDGYFHGPGAKYYLATVDGRSLLIMHWASFNLDMVASEKLEKLAAPQELAVAIDGRQWLRRNARAYEGPSAEGYVFSSRLIPALPGYAEFGGIVKVTGPTTASYPIGAIRDLEQLILTNEDGVTWAWINGMLYSAADAAKTLDGGSASLTIGSQGYAEWLKIGQDSVLSFTKPKQGKVLVFDPAGTLIYDSTTDSGEVFVAAGGFVAVAGNPADTFAVLALTR
jgi:CubicO group peptidase (beta-lactamase class C family)